MYFLIEDDELLKKYNDIWNKINNSIRKEFDNEPIYNEKKIIKTKLKSYGDETADFHDKETAKVGSNYICLGLKLINFVL